MDGLFTEAFLTSLLLGAVTAGVPLLLAGLGEQISEKAGVLNIGIEGMMLAGAYAGFLGAYYTRLVLARVPRRRGIGGALVAALMALLCVRLGLNQIVIGIALTLGAEGLTALLHHFQFSADLSAPGRRRTLRAPVARDIPILGPALFEPPPDRLSRDRAGLRARHGCSARTNLGLNLQAAGDKPAALDAAGVDVVTTRAFAVLATGVLAGIGGAFLANVGAGLFVPVHDQRRRLHRHRAGHAGARPAGLGAVRRASVRRLPVLTTALQVAGVNIPTDVIQMLPFADGDGWCWSSSAGTAQPAGGARPALCARRALRSPRNSGMISQG